jgi:hypothetical protein
MSLIKPFWGVQCGEIPARTLRPLPDHVIVFSLWTHCTFKFNVHSINIAVALCCHRPTMTVIERTGLREVNISLHADSARSGPERSVGLCVDVETEPPAFACADVLAWTQTWHLATPDSQA